MTRSKNPRGEPRAATRRFRTVGLVGALLVTFIFGARAEAEEPRRFASIVLEFELITGTTARSEVYKTMLLEPRPGVFDSFARRFLMFSNNLRFVAVNKVPAQWRTGQGRADVVVQPENDEKGKLRIAMRDAEYVFCNWEARITSFKHPTDHPVVLSLSIESDTALTLHYAVPTRFLGMQNSRVFFHVAIVGVLKAALSDALAKKECIPAWTGGLPIKID